MKLLALNSLLAARFTYSRPGSPAVPKAWPTGKVTGLRARGNFTVDIDWKNSKVTKYRVASPEPREVKVRVNGETKAIHSEKL